ncbi:hypothetical protein ACN28E_26965 [Archangium lansingense]|uniref:hypothetical protein n=1 Tax=Archangium lansingense TaxID=2995310 RepID=UPI003B812024
MTDDPTTKLMKDMEALLSDPSKADLLLLLIGTPIESDTAREQIRSFLLGKLLTRGIRKGEAAAKVERGLRGYRAQLLLKQEEGAQSLGWVTVPLHGYDEAAFEAAVRKAGITTLDDPNVCVVTLRNSDPPGETG